MFFEQKDKDRRDKLRELESAGVILNEFGCMVRDCAKFSGLFGFSFHQCAGLAIQKVTKSFVDFTSCCIDSLTLISVIHEESE